MLKQGAVLKDAMSTSHKYIKLVKYSPPKRRYTCIFRRIKKHIPGDSGRIGVRTYMCHTRWTVKVDALGSIISNCTVLRSRGDDAKDVDRARYSDKGKNSRRCVSNEHIPLPVRDHARRPTAETRQQFELNSEAHVAFATKVNN